MSGCSAVGVDSDGNPIIQCSQSQLRAQLRATCVKGQAVSGSSFCETGVQLSNGLCQLSPAACRTQVGPGSTRAVATCVKGTPIRGSPYCQTGLQLPNGLCQLSSTACGPSQGTTGFRKATNNVAHCADTLRDGFRKPTSASCTTDLRKGNGAGIPTSCAYGVKVQIPYAGVHGATVYACYVGTKTGSCQQTSC